MHLLVSVIEQYGLIAIFINVLLENLSLPLPSYPVLMIAAALTPTHHYQPLDIILVGIGANVLADCLWFWAGQRFGTNIVGFLCKISLSPDSCVRKTGVQFARNGELALIFTKFLPGISTVAIVLAGAAKMPLRTFLLFDTLGAAAYISVGVVLGLLFRDNIDATLKLLSHWGHWGLLAIAAAVAGYVLFKWWQRWRFLRKMRMDRITVNELHGLMDEGKHPVILDVRPAELRAAQGTIPGSVLVDMLKLEPIALQFSQSPEVVVYCSCPNEASAAVVANKLKKAGFMKIRPLLGGIEAWAKAGYVVETLVPA